MLYTVSWTSHGVELVELQLPPVITGLREHATLAAFFPIPLLSSASGASQAHLPNELLTLESLSQGWLLGEPKLKQIGIMYSFQLKSGLNPKSV